MFAVPLLSVAIAPIASVALALIAIDAVVSVSVGRTICTTPGVVLDVKVPGRATGAVVVTIGKPNLPLCDSCEAPQ